MFNTYKARNELTTVFLNGYILLFSPLIGLEKSYEYDNINNRKMVKEHLCELIAGDGYSYGYKKLTACLQE